jgi:hypothetical protein
MAGAAQSLSPLLIEQDRKARGAYAWRSLRSKRALFADPTYENLALQQLAVRDLRSYATIQTVWGETESYQFSIDYRYSTGTTTKTSSMDSTTSSDSSERLRTAQ